MNKFSGGRHLAAITLLDLTGIQKAVLHDIASQLDFNRLDTATRYMTYEQIAERISFSKTVVYQAVKYLRENDFLIVKTIEKNARFAANRYRLGEKVFSKISPHDIYDTPKISPHDIYDTPKISPHDILDIATRDGDPISPYLNIYKPDSDQKLDRNTINMTRDIRSALPKPPKSVTDARVRNIASIIHSANRPPSGWYCPPAEWSAAIRPLARAHENVDFGRLADYLRQHKVTAQGVIVPATLAQWLNAALNDLPMPSQQAATSNYTTYKEAIKKKPQTKTEANWVETLDIAEIKDRLVNTKLKADTKKQLIIRYALLGGNPQDLRDYL